MTWAFSSMFTTTVFSQRSLGWFAVSPAEDGNGSYILHLPHSTASIEASYLTFTLCARGTPAEMLVILSGILWKELMLLLERRQYR